jgi:glycosyltransferase involved in cell wall biosynthesis
MHIAFVIPYFYPALQYGGQPKSCYDLARALVRRGHSVTVLTTDTAGNSRLALGSGAVNKRSIEGIDVIYYRNLSNYLAFRHRVFLPFALFQDIDRQLAGCDILHIHELRSPVSVAAYRSAARLRIPFVLSTHGGLQWLGKRGAKFIFDKLWGREILASAMRLVAISPVEEQDVRMFNVKPEKIRLLPNTVFPDDYSDLPATGAFRREWNIREDKIVLFLGRQHWIKGADLLVAAMARADTATPSVRLVIAGPDDGQERELRRMLAGTPLEHRTTFTGFLDHKAKLKALVDADILVVPSRSEVFAITALEAMMCGTPVLLSSSCGLFPAPGGECGIRRFESGNVLDLAGKLELILNQTANKSFAAGREFVSREFCPASVAERAEGIYEEAIGRG